jgi:hypothetical protein
MTRWNPWLLLLLTPALLQCRQPDEVEITETRQLTTRDTPPLLDATSDQRFRNARPSPVRGTPPDHWHVLPSSQFRLLNYRFGANGTGEVWVTIASGGLLENVNRWLTQFSQKPLDEAGLAELRRVPIAGTTGVWTTATGTYAAGMGTAGPQENYALAGVVAEIDGRILTVKMVGPQAEVEAEAAALEAFSASLVWTQG